jgi:transcriptional regulator with XRE-family HTH domain
MAPQQPKSMSRVVGRRIAAARRTAGLSQRELAARLGWPRDTLINFEYGRRTVDIDRLVAIAVALGHHPAIFLFEAHDTRVTMIEEIQRDPELAQHIAFFMRTLLLEQSEDAVQKNVRS